MKPSSNIPKRRIARKYIKKDWRLDKALEGILKREEKKMAGKEKKRLKRQERIEVMKTLRAKGYTLQQIGDQFGITRERVRQLLK